jgi:hypothetical protein
VLKENEMKRFVRLIGFPLQIIFCWSWLEVHAEEGKISNLDSLLKELTRGRQVISSPFDLSFEPVPMPSAPGPANLKVSISPNMCEDVTITVTKIDKLEYSGDVSWSFHGVPEDTYSFELGVVIPSNDTSGIEIEVKCDPWSEEFVAYFVTTTDKVEYYYYDPRLRFPSSEHKAPRMTIDYSHIPWEPGPHGEGTSSTGYEDEAGNWVPIDSVKDGFALDGRRVGFFDDDGRFVALDSLLKTTETQPDTVTQPMTSPDRSKIWMHDQDGKLIQVDTVWLFDSVRQAAIQDQLEEMRRREESPLADKDHEVITVGDTLYERHRGESKFRPMERVFDRSARFDNKRDSILALMGDKKLDVILDLRDPEHYEFVRSLIDSLVPSEEPGFYRAVVPFDLLQKLAENGIDVSKNGTRSREKNDKGQNNSQQLNSIDEETEDPGELGNPSVQLFFEGLECTFPGSIWSVWDDYSGSGYDYWGVESCRSHSGSKSVWCSGEGNMPPCEYDDLDMLAYMDMVQGIDISGYTNVIFSFRIWSQLTQGTGDECDYYFSSPDVAEWIWLGAIDSTSNGWLYESFTVPGEWDSAVYT